jgi:predicted nucleotidyltransferase
MKKDIYNKVTKFYRKKRIAVTYAILNYMMSNVDNICQFSEEIENAENYLIKNNCSYDSIQKILNQTKFGDN